MTTWAERAEKRKEFEIDNHAKITELDYALNCATIEIDTTNARAELAQLRADLQAAQERNAQLEQAIDRACEQIENGDLKMARQLLHDAYKANHADLNS